MLRTTILVAVGLSGTATPMPSRGTVREVDARGGTPYATIQSAIDASVPSQDEVLVHCGIYVENVVLKSDVPVRGQGARCTIIDGGGIGAVATLPATGPLTVLEGFTITNGSSGGIRVLGGAPVITGNVIAENGNAPYEPPFVSGGGVYVTGGAGAGLAPTVTRNVIRRNAAFNGGGVFAANHVRITSNVIADNRAVFGGGIEADFGPVTIANNTIVLNTGDYGGGILLDNPAAVLANNVIVGNLAYATAGDFYRVGPGTVTFVSNDSWGNVPYQAYPGGMPGPGNFSANPQILDTPSDDFAGWQPQSTSPLIDAASSAYAPGADLRGISPPVDGDANGIRVPDVGARENEGLTQLRVEGVAFVWDLGLHVPPDYRIYRGDLETLQATGRYTQDPAIVPGARHFCDWGPYLADPDYPESGRVFFYIAVAWGVVEGTLGFDSRGVERPRTVPCQGP